MHEDMDLLAAEYVLGSMEREEHESFTRQVRSDPNTRQAVELWEARLAGLLNLRIEGVGWPAPSEALWRRIVGAIGFVNERRYRWPTFSRQRTAAHAPVRRRHVAAAALAAASLAGVAIGVASPRQAAWPLTTHSANLEIARGQTVSVQVLWLPRAVAQIVPGKIEVGPRESMELWWIAQGHAPRSLGLVASGHTRYVALSAPPESIGQGTLAISREPRGGSPHAGPSGPVLASAQLTKS